METLVLTVLASSYTPPEPTTAPYYPPEFSVGVDALTGKCVLVDLGAGRTAVLTNAQARYLARELVRAANEIPGGGQSRY